MRSGKTVRVTRQYPEIVDRAISMAKDQVLMYMIEDKVIAIGDWHVTEIAANKHVADYEVYVEVESYG